MTRKSGGKLLAAHTKNSSSGPGAGAGYCEVCRVNYDWLEDHISSVGHIKAVTDPTQYQELDSLISVSASAWLGQRKSSRIRSPTPLQQSPPPPTILNCNGHDNSHQGLTNGVSVRGSSDRKSPGGRRGRVIRKRLSAEEKLIEDNKAYYKVEVLNSKLRSTGTLQRQLGSSGGREEEENDDEEKSNGRAAPMGAILSTSSLHNGQSSIAPATSPDSVVVRFKKVRKAELKMLSNEAENFMFGEKEEETPDDAPSQSHHDSSADTARKRRRTHAELFINDNTDYYKFELPGSRLRYQGTTLAHVPTPAKEESPHLRLRSDRSPLSDERVPSRLRSAGKSPPQEEQRLRTSHDREDHHYNRSRSFRSPIDDGPVHRRTRGKSPLTTEPTPRHQRLRSNRSPTADESFTGHHRLRSNRSPTDDELPPGHHRLRSAGGKSPRDEPYHQRLRWNRSPTDDELSNHPRLRSGGRSSTDDEHILRTKLTRNPCDDEDSGKGTESLRPGLRSSSRTPPPLEPKLRSWPGLSPMKDRVSERQGLPSEEDLAPELTLSHADITYAFEMSNTDGVWAKVQERLDKYKEEVLPHHYAYPTVLLPFEMPYLDRLKLLTRRRRRISRCLDDRPRKSPRCHASTLAIMSSVLPRSCGGGVQSTATGVQSTATGVQSTATGVTAQSQASPSPATTVAEPSTAEDEDTTASSLTADSTISDPTNDPRALYIRYMAHYASLLDSVNSKDGKMSEPPHDETIDPTGTLGLLKQPDFLWMMDNDRCPLIDACFQETIFNLRSFDLDSCNSSDCSEIFGFSEDGRSYFGRRKKKKRHNLTGWPKEKPRRKLLAYAKKPRFVRSEPLGAFTDPDGLLPSLSDPRSDISPVKKKRGRPRLYPPGMSPSLLKIKMARENAMKRSSLSSPIKPRPSLKAHPL